MSTLLLTTVLVLVVWLTQSLRFLDMIVNRAVSLQGYFYLIGFLLPDLLVLLLPICLFISIMYHYNRLISDHEVSIWKGAGQSPLCMALPAFALTNIVMCIVFSLNLFVIPQTFSHFKSMEHELRQQFSGAMLQEGKFNNFKGITVYVKERYRSGRLRDILIYNKQKKPYSIIAEEGRVEMVNGKVQLLLKKGIRQEIDAHTKKLSFFSFDTLHYDLDSLLTVKNDRTIRPHERSLRDLLSPDHSVDPQLKPKYKAAGHVRILQPLFGWVYTLIAFVFLFSGHYKRKSRHKMIALGFFMAFLFHIGMISLINLNGKIEGALYATYALYIIIFLGLSTAFLKPDLLQKRFPKEKL